MAFDPQNPLGMIPDPYAGDLFVLPKTLCTDERRSWFKRSNDIISFLTVTELALKECKNKYDALLLQQDLNPDTPLKLKSSDGRSVLMPARRFSKQCADAVDVLCRQVFVMLYGSLETFLFQLFERSFRKMGITDGILDRSRNILMKRKWDGRFCKISNEFALDYKAGDLNARFCAFEMNFGGTIYKNPLGFLDELARIRHRIVHASSILEKDKLVFINARVFHEMYAFYRLLTDYIDDIFAKKFGYLRLELNPAEA